jgi:hypothetical protein
LDTALPSLLDDDPPIPALMLPPPLLLLLLCWDLEDDPVVLAAFRPAVAWDDEWMDAAADVVEAFFFLGFDVT